MLVCFTNGSEILRKRGVYGCFAKVYDGRKVKANMVQAVLDWLRKPGGRGLEARNWNGSKLSGSFEYDDQENLQRR